MEPKRRNRLGLATAVALVGFAVLAPASSNAATTIGALWDNPNGGACDAGNVYTQSQVNNPGVRPTFNVPAAPGVITAWATRAGATAGLQGTLKVVRNNGNTSITVLGTSALQTLTPNTVNTFTTRIPVSGGELIGYGVRAGGPNQPCFDNGSDNADNVIGGPDPSPGNQIAVDGNVFPRNQSRMNLTATVEADADRDGFGDETQDRCRGSAGSNGGCPAGTAPTNPGGGSDRTKPTLGGLSFSRGTFAAAKSGGAFSSQKGRKKKKSTTPTGTKVSFTLSEASSVKFSVQRKTTGRRSSGKCRTRTRSNRKKPKCTLWKNVTGSFTVAGKAGKNTFTFRGRIGGKALRTGSYRLNGTATDPAKNKSAPKNKTFRIVR